MQRADIQPFVSIFISLGITAACLFGAAGRLDWANAWMLLGLSLLTGVAFTAGRDPELSAERRNLGAGKSWDKALAGSTVLLGPMALWITAGLEFRFRGPGRLPAAATVAGLAAAALASALIAWAMRSNRFFSAVVRIQKDRGHTVVEGGPYRYIRHPGYAGMAVFVLVTPLILGSVWALAPAGITAALTVLRTSLEDSTPRAELEDYQDYAGRVRYRLLPGIGRGVGPAWAPAAGVGLGACPTPRKWGRLWG